MRTIQDYQSFTASHIEEEMELNAFESACTEEGVELNESYDALNEEDVWPEIQAMMKAQDKVISSVTNGVAGGMKFVADVLKKGGHDAVKDAKSAAAAGKAVADAVKKEPKMSQAAKTYVSTLEKLLAQAKKNPNSFVLHSTQQSLAGLLAMSHKITQSYAKDPFFAKVAKETAAKSGKEAAKSAAGTAIQVGKMISGLFN